MADVVAGFRDGVAVLVPALDCAETIAEVVRGALHTVPDVLVVDDGSRDGTAKRAAAAGAEVLRHDMNRGKGAALLHGLRCLAADGFTRVLTMDGDGQHPASELPRLLERSSALPAAIVIGERLLATADVAPINLLGNRWADRLVSFSCGRSVVDTQSGFRVYPAAETLALGTRSTGFAFESEVLVRAARAGLSIESVPVRVHYPPPAERVSHYQRVRDTVRIGLVLARLSLRLW